MPDFLIQDATVGLVGQSLSVVLIPGPENTTDLLTQQCQLLVASLTSADGSDLPGVLTSH